jgi:hypothetical protein
MREMIPDTLGVMLDGKLEKCNAKLMLSNGKCSKINALGFL